MANKAGKALSDNDAVNVAGGNIGLNEDGTFYATVTGNIDVLKEGSTLTPDQLRSLNNFLEKNKDKIKVKTGKGQRESLEYNKTFNI